jgi:hypothetical protein
MEQHADHPSMTEVPPPRASVVVPKAVSASAPAPPTKRPNDVSEMSISLDSSPASRAFVETAMRGSPTPSQRSAAAAARNADGESLSAVLKMIATAVRTLENTVNRRLDSVESILARSMSESKSNLKPLQQKMEISTSSIGAVQIMLDMLSQNAKDTGLALQTLQESITSSAKVAEAAAPVVAESPASAVSTAVGLSVAESQGATRRQDGGSAFIGGASEYMVILPDEFERIQRDRNLKHIWVFMNYKDGEPARKIRVSGITAEELQHVYSKGGAVYPFSKTCDDWDAFIAGRNRYFAERNRY